jgi:hypothetical protein
VNGVLVAFAVSFGVVFVAELGDKSQLMALTFATRYRALPVLVGITLATAVVHAVSVAVGYGLGSALPMGWIALVAAVAFFGFGAWTLRGDTLTDDERAKAERSTGSAIVAASVAFFLAELGDKTSSPPSPWPRSTAGSAPGSARPWAWSPRTRWPSPSAASSAGTCRREPSSMARRRCSSSSACGSWSTRSPS